VRRERRRQASRELEALSTFDIPRRRVDGSYPGPFCMGYKAFRVNLLLISKFVHKPSAHDLLQRDLRTPQTKKRFLRGRPCGLSR